MADQPYVSFPGLAGNFISTPDVNLLDADTAHLQQSRGKWAGFGVGAPVLGSPIAPVFGDTCGVSVLAGDLTGIQTPSAVSTGILAEPNTEYTISISVAGNSAGSPVGELRVLWFDNANGFLGAGQNDLPYGSDWSRNEITLTSPANTAVCVVRLLSRGHTSGDEMYFDAASFRAGSDPTFVPSLRIVGDLDFGIDQSRADWTGNQIYLLSNWITAAAPFRLITIAPTGNLFATLTINGTERAIGNTTSPTPGRHTIRVTRIKDSGVTSLTVDGSETDGSTLDPDQSVDYSQSSNLSIGNAVGSIVNEGDVYSAWLRDGVDGPIVAQFDAADVGGAT